MCNFIAGFSPTFWFLLLFRALLGFGMGAEWPAGAVAGDGDLADPLARLYERRAAGLVGPRLSAVERDLWAAFTDSIGWRGMLWVGIRAGAGDRLRPLLCQRAGGLGREPPAASAPRSARSGCRCSRSSSRGMLGNTLTACWFQARGFVTYYSINALFATHLQKDLGLSPALDRDPADPGQPVCVSRQLELGLGVGHVSAAVRQ